MVGVGFFLTVISNPAHAQWMPIPGEDDDPIPTVSELMEAVRDAFPDEPLVVIATLERRGAEIDSPRAYRVRLHLVWGGDPPEAHVRISDAFGEFLSEGRVTYRETGAEFRFSGETDPTPGDSIFDTDFTWGDLALSFLWWPGGTFRGIESRRGRSCYVVDIPNPNPSEKEAAVRLWIDRHVHALLQAEVRSERGEPVRRLSVRSLRRVGPGWTLEDVEMRSLPANTRTLFRVEELYTLEPHPESP